MVEPSDIPSAEPLKKTSERKSGERTALWVALAGVAGAVIGAAITSGFSYLSHQNDLAAKMIELSVGILRAEVTPETTPLRQWAIDVIDKRANFRFDKEQRAVLLKQQLPLPVYLLPPDGYRPGVGGLPLGGLPGVGTPQQQEEALKNLRRLQEKRKQPSPPSDER